MTPIQDSNSHTSLPYTERNPAEFVYTASESRRLLTESSRLNSAAVDHSQLVPDHSSIPPRFSKSFDYELVILDRKYFKRFIYISVSILLLILALVLLLHFLPRKHKHHGPSKNLTLAVNLALTFFDAQKSGVYPKNSLVNFRGDSGLQDGKLQADLVGGFYDSGNNMKFSFPTAYTVTLLSWTVIEYHQKYNEIGELNHVKDIIRWGTDYLLKLFIPPQNATSDKGILYSQVGIAGNDSSPGDVICWERPEGMDYPRPVSSCDASSASDLAGEVVAALSATSLVFKEESDYSEKLVQRAEKLFELASKKDPSRGATYTSLEDLCGKEAINFYNSSGYLDELVWGGTWLSFATGNTSYLKYATDLFNATQNNETSLDKGIFYWNNKLVANAVLLTRLRFFKDPGFPYESALGQSESMIESIMCSYVSGENINKTAGGLILQRPVVGEHLELAATASFLGKLYSDYLESLSRSGGSCSNYNYSLKMLRTFSISQVDYILGDNPMKMSYVVGFGQQFPTQVHHRSASTPFDGQHYSCKDGEKWLQSKNGNPNTILGAMVAGPDRLDKFEDQRDKPIFTEPSISSNAGLVAALIALHDPPPPRPKGSFNTNFGIDISGLFENIKLIPAAP